MISGIGRRLSVQTRVSAAVVAVLVMGVSVTGMVAAAVQLRQVDQRVDAALAQEVGELRAFAGDGVDLDTGESFTAVRDLLFVSAQRTVLSSNEALLVVVDAVAYRQPGSGGPRLGDDPRVLELAAAVRDDDPPRFATVRDPAAASGSRDLRLVLVPVSVPDDPSSGVMIYGYDRQAERGAVLSTLFTTGIVALGMLMITGIVAFALIGRLLAPLRILRETAGRLSDEDLSRRIPVEGHDDISELTRTVNGMLDRLEAAFTAQRALLDDVGHELRTPLTVIRGHLELIDPNDPLDVGETRRLLLDEIDRMHRLVEELTLLAQSQRPDFLQCVEVDVDELVGQVLARVRALAERRWRHDSLSQAVLHADPQRLVQALIQLVANAVAVTSPADEIGVGSSISADGKVHLWVRDSGPGIDPADQQRIFERFKQGTDLPRQGGEVGAAGACVTGGSGLGLAIVSAIVEAHGGTVLLWSTLGGGATFVLELPRTLRPSPRLSTPTALVPVQT